MSKTQLDGAKVAILVADGFEQAEMTEPRKALDAAGAATRIVSPKNNTVRGWKHHKPADEFDVDIPLPQAAAHEFDALVLPGGVMNPDALRINEEAIAFVRDFLKAGKPVAAICHGPWTLIEAAHRPDECRRQVGGPRGRGRRQPDHQPQAPGPAGLRPRDGQAVCRGAGARLSTKAVVLHGAGDIRPGIVPAAGNQPGGCSSSCSPRAG
jgi:putative intracellular protease/amidase